MGVGERKQDNLNELGSESLAAQVISGWLRPRYGNLGLQVWVNIFLYSM